MKVNIVIGDVVWEVSCYCPQVCRSANEKEELYELMGKVVTSEKVLVGGHFNGHLVVIWVVLDRSMAVFGLGK